MAGVEVVVRKKKWMKKWCKICIQKCTKIFLFSFIFRRIWVVEFRSTIFKLSVCFQGIIVVCCLMCRYEIRWLSPKKGYIACEFIGTEMNYETIALTTHNSENSLFAALRRFVLGAARLVVFRLVGCLRRNGLARCWDGSVSLDVWGKYSRPPCSFVCLVIGESRRYLH